MVNPCPDGFSVLLHYWFEGQWRAHPISYRPRNLVHSFWNGSKVVSNIVGRVSSWESGYVDEIEDIEFGIFSTLSEWHVNCMENWECSLRNFLQPVIDEIKRAEANLWNGISGGV